MSAIAWTPPTPGYGHKPLAVRFAHRRGASVAWVVCAWEPIWDDARNRPIWRRKLEAA